MNWLKYLVGFSALIIAGCAAYFSVTGLGVLFSGAAVSVMIMAGALEFAKLVAATYLKQKWDTIKGFNKWYLVSAVGVIMLITSAGIFGYLSNAFQQQNLKLGQIEREISVFQNQITTNDSEISRFTAQIANLQQIRSSQEANISKIIERNGSTSRLSIMVRNADKEISNISIKINNLTEKNNKNYEKINEIKNSNIETEREVGGFRFVAEMFGVELKNVVKFFIFLIVIVFDPLAIALVIAFNGMVNKKKDKQKKYITDIMQSDDELGLYDNLDDLIEENYKNYQIYGDIEKNSTIKNENDEINKKKENESIGTDDDLVDVATFDEDTNNNTLNLQWEEWMHPDFPWNNRKLWINNSKAVNYWLSTRGGSVRELSKIRSEQENIKTY